MDLWNGKGYVAGAPICGPLLILSPTLKRWDPPDGSGLGDPKIATRGAGVVVARVPYDGWGGVLKWASVLGRFVILVLAALHLAVSDSMS